MGAERVVVPAPTVDEPGSFDDFYRREWPGAVRLAHLLTGVDAVAEDLAQESFTRIEPRWQVIATGSAWKAPCGRLWTRRSPTTGVIPSSTGCCSRRCRARPTCWPSCTSWRRPPGAACGRHGERL